MLVYLQPLNKEEVLREEKELSEYHTEVLIFIEKYRLQNLVKGLKTHTFASRLREVIKMFLFLKNTPQELDKLPLRNADFLFFFFKEKLKNIGFKTWLVKISFIHLRPVRK